MKLTKEVLEALAASQDDGPLGSIVQMALGEMSTAHRILAEALLKQNMENMARFQKLFESQQTLVQTALDRAFGIASTKTYATVAGGRPRRAVGTQQRPPLWTPQQTSPSPASSGPAISPPGEQDDVILDDERPLPEHDDDEVMDLIADSSGPPPMNPPR